ncbi:fasciculation and elongation protein zeta-2 isoform X1 [Carassius auratus]|uniref:Fasciculation and elongation protein zeta-2 isoform X1 n=1 Tax=Carassius auratus TaxID=7957 RepID=A0A6P6R4Y5_CARAU|nr:fasciculation and elongation protein zeta-2-like isoform X1 [Carassius auratus]
MSCVFAVVGFVGTEHSSPVAVMAEPSSRRDDDDWDDFNEFKSGTGRKIHLERARVNAEEMSLLLDGVSVTEHAFETSPYTQDLITHFDEKLQLCFQNVNPKPDTINPVLPINEDTSLRCDEIWNALTDNYGSVMPVDWSQSKARSLHLSALSIEDRPRMESVNLDLSDDEELREQMDTHSIIVSCISEEPLLTAEQVIEELEELMQDSPELESERMAPHSELSLVSHSSRTDEEREYVPLGVSCGAVGACLTLRCALCAGVRLMSALELNVQLEDVETAIRRYSEELIQQLAVRDELEFEKEVKNSFISVLIDVQNRQKLHREMLRKKRKVKNASGSERLPSSRFSVEGISSVIQNGFRHTFGNVGGEKQYVTTVIPYERKDGPPSLQDLQIFTKILEAMRDDNEKVPSLLTDYILKVLCPT